VDARGDAGEVQPPTPQKRGPSGLPLESPTPAREGRHVGLADTERRDEPRRGMLRRGPFAFDGGLILLFLALPAGYLYWDYASHFESTDDPSSPHVC
jgi:membrane fusion protein (multidrug efflux system)